MIEVKTVSRGNSLALSLPKDGRFKKGQRWLLIPSSDGESYTLVPRIENPYAGSKPKRPMTEAWSDVDWNDVE
ncbi:transcription elongation factor GreAB [Lactiplantibacillus paraplantarum]|uniref:type II toxin-antitoxin system PemI/MazE family antitoxin n=1 Tax=Lactiplantibacillus paraplantarum TaxID=60520 RepID=UPI0021A8D99D|nr:transcription elongation factor GreAB [Lactiplantibacillus paraplantarum]MCT4458704.1 transcription elongation factor GreAB [Lactiplantibacillus paraplantarum]